MAVHMELRLRLAMDAVRKDMRWSLQSLHDASLRGYGDVCARNPVLTKEDRQDILLLLQSHTPCADGDSENVLRLGRAFFDVQLILAELRLQGFWFLWQSG
jgi:hypothetical protein